MRNLQHSLFSLILILAFTGLEAQHSVARQWNEVLLIFELVLKQPLLAVNTATVTNNAAV